MANALPMPMKNVLDHCVDLALAAGREIMSVYGSDAITSSTKADKSPFTEADIRAEAVILEGLRRSFPNIPVIAEEEAAAGRISRSSSLLFLVDPLDGTKEFLNRNGEFTVNIALIDASLPVAGVVYAPALGDIFIGSGAGAFRACVAEGICSEWLPISTRRAGPDMTAVGSRSHAVDAVARWLKERDVARFVSRGSSLKFCLVAAGEADLYPRLGRTMEWDTAAGDAVLRAAGGIVTDLEGQPMIYNKRDQGHDVDFANGHFVAYGDPAAVDRSGFAGDRLV